jgi:hypothetical protein
LKAGLGPGFFMANRCIAPPGPSSRAKLTELRILWHITSMKNQLKFLMIVLCGQILSQAIAADPPSTPTPAAQPTAATASTPTDPSSAAAAEEAKKAADAAQAKRLRGLGYRPEVQNGTTLFCKKEDVIGSRFPIKNCASADSIEASEKLKQENLASAPKPLAGPGSPRGN